MKIQPFVLTGSKYILLLSGLILLFLTGCDSLTKKTPKAQEETIQAQPEKIITPSDKMSIESRRQARRDETCKTDNCTQASIDYPYLSRVNNRINRALDKEIISVLRKYTAPAKGYKKMEDYLDAFISDYQDFKKDFPESTVPWTLDITCRMTGEFNNILSFKINTASYTGGAHSIDEVKFLNLGDRGEIIEPKALFPDQEKLYDLAEKAFREKYNLKSSDDLASAGFSFENNKFTLTENMGISGDQIILYYNSYEISDYASGPTELKVPLNKFK